MKYSILVATIAVAGVFGGAALNAQGQDTSPKQFRFTSTGDDTTLDGSTITISTAPDGSFEITDWDMMFTFDPIRDVELTSGSGNSHLQEEDITSYGVGAGATWIGTFEIVEDRVGNLHDANENFNGSNTTPGGVGDGTLAVSTDPAGTWVAVVPPPVPDAQSSVQLLFLALTGLGASKRLFRK